MITINKNAILSIEDEDDKYLIIRMNDIAQTAYRCPKIFTKYQINLLNSISHHPIDLYTLPEETEEI